MQVLVALAQARAEVLSRERLSELCWGGRIVGDDSLNRCIQSLRGLAKFSEVPAFRIETITGVGYVLTTPSYRSAEGSGADRVKAEGSGSDRGPARYGTVPDLARPSRWSWYRRPLLYVSGLAAVAATAFWLLGTDRSAPSVAVMGDGGYARSQLAGDLTVDLTRLAGARIQDVTILNSASEADFLVQVSAERAARSARGNLRLFARSPRELLWSTTVEAPSQDLSDLRLQMAAALGGVLLCAIDMRRSGLELSHGTQRSYLASCQEEQSSEQQIALLRGVVERAPNFSRAWANLAVAEAAAYDMAGFNSSAGLDPQRLKAAARKHLLQARKLDPSLGATYVAEAALLDRRDWLERIAVLSKGVAVDPQHAPLHNGLSHVLFDVGRTGDAVATARRASDLDPLSQGVRTTLINALAHAGNLAQARRELREAIRVWPDSRRLREARFSMELRYGSAQVAQSMIDRGEASLGGSTGGFGGPEAMMSARLNPTPRTRARLIQSAAFDAARAPTAVPLRLQALGQFDAIDEAYRMLGQPGAMGQLQRATGILFRPHLRDLRFDKRFPALSARLGLLHYWQSADTWPDFCADPRLPYNCKVEARRLIEQPLRVSPKLTRSRMPENVTTPL